MQLEPVLRCTHICIRSVGCSCCVELIKSMGQTQLIAHTFYCKLVYRSVPVLIQNVLAERLSARLLILQCMFSVGGVWCHASRMQFVTLRNAPKSCIHIHKFIFLSAVAALVVSLSWCQMAKVVKGAKKKKLEAGAKTKKTARKCSLNAMKFASRPMSRRATVSSEAKKARGRLDKRPYLRILCGSNALAFSNSFNVKYTLHLPSHNFYTSFVAHAWPTSPKARATPTN